MKPRLLWVLFSLVPLLHPLSEGSAWAKLAVPPPAAQSLSEYFEPGQLETREPLPIKQIIGLVIAGLSSAIILLFVFSFLMGPGERIREKMSEAGDPFFTIVAILLVVLFLTMLQTYYSDILAWLKAVTSSG